MRRIATIILLLFVFLSLHANDSNDNLRNNALKGDKKSCLALGNEYFFGINRPVNLTLAVFWYRKATIQPGVPEAFFNLGICYLNGWGIKESKQTGFLYLTKAANLGNKQAIFHLAKLYFSGIKEEENDLEIKKAILPDPEKAIKLLEKLIKENYPKSKEFLAFSLYSNPQYKEKYSSYIRKLILEVANEKNSTSKNLILASKILSQGLGGQVDLVLSTKYLSKAKDLNDITALGLYAQALEEGLGIKPNKEEAIKLYKEAALKGDALSQVKLGQFYLFGANDTSNSIQAVELFTQAAKQNYGPAFRELGFCYNSGIGVEQNLKKSFEYYQKGAAVYDSISFIKLADAYLNGIGTYKDINAALYWYRKASLVNEVEGMRKYGKLLLTFSDKKLQQEGIFYLNKAAKLGDEEAILILEDISNE